MHCGCISHPRVLARKPSLRQGTASPRPRGPMPR
jgi:hypothetical protein